MTAGQVVMVMIMTSTPLHIHHHGSDLGIVGLVMSAHTLGMFALSPLTGRLTDRWGGYRVIMWGMALLGLSALVAAYGPNDSTTLLVVVLFALGYGWNLAFVAGSSMLTIGVGSDIRSRLQGRVDSLTWTAGALASVSSGVIYQASDYRAIQPDRAFAPGCPRWWSCSAIGVHRWRSEPESREDQALGSQWPRSIGTRVEQDLDLG